MIFIDTETCGLHGAVVLIQYAEDDGPVVLHSVWKTPIRDTLALVERFCNHPGGLVFFNAAFDWFHIVKIYNLLRLCPDPDAYPEDIVDQIAEFEPEARDGPCIKPVKCHDVMLHARTTSYQSTMDRGDIRIRRVPTALAWLLASELEKRIPLSDIYFARKKNKTRWNVYDIETDDGMCPNFKDVVLKFAPSSALKALAVDIGLVPIDEVVRFDDIGVDPVWYPEEVGYCPLARALGGTRHDWKGAWPDKIKHHIAHWEYHTRARFYAGKDVEYTRSIYKHFGSPELGDDNSELACMVAAVRWKGFVIDIPKLKALREKALTKIGETPMAPNQVRAYIHQVMDETERLGFGGSTKRTILEDLAKLTIPCPACNSGAIVAVEYNDVSNDVIVSFDDNEESSGQIVSRILQEKYANETTDCNCKICNGSGKTLHPAAKRAKEVLDARHAVKEIELYDKLIRAGRFHASVKVIGALSGRMSGADGLNPQGVKSTKEVRSCFPFAYPDTVLAGGDFAGFEVTLAEADYKDPDLRRDLLTCEKCEGEMEPAGNCKECGYKEGKAIHALFGVFVFPDMTYDQIKATKGKEDDRYTRCKQAVFAMFYGGEGFTLKSRLGVDLDIANEAYVQFTRRYKQVGIVRRRVAEDFCSMTQPGGLGSKVVWREPKEFIESMLGFRRYFTLENRITKALFDLAEKPPRAWQEVKVKVLRRDREQLVAGAARSALFGAAFALQASNTRAAMNHRIQATGSQITKRTQRRIWDLQPAGIHPWLVQTLNVHDEILCVTEPTIVDKVKERVDETVETFRPTVPLIKMEWQNKLNTWADK